MRPYSYQLRCVKKIEEFGGRALLAAAPGLGKTLMALTYLKRHPEALPVVVVCPAVIKYHWERKRNRCWD